MNTTHEEWIPLAFYTSESNINNRISGRSPDTVNKIVNIRGFNVSYVIWKRNEIHTAQLRLCVDNIAAIKFRWLQTTVQAKVANRDRILLDDIEISTQRRIFLRDDFDNQTTTKLK